METPAQTSVSFLGWDSTEDPPDLSEVEVKTSTISALKLKGWLDEG